MDHRSLRGKETEVSRVWVYSKTKKTIYEEGPERGLGDIYSQWNSRNTHACTLGATAPCINIEPNVSFCPETDLPLSIN